MFLIHGKALKQGTKEVWNSICEIISGAIDGIIGFFKNMWNKACEYIDKTVDKLKELNPFQDKMEAFGARVFDRFNGNPFRQVDRHN